MSKHEVLLDILETPPPEDLSMVYVTFIIFNPSPLNNYYPGKSCYMEPDYFLAKGGAT